MSPAFVPVAAIVMGRQRKIVEAFRAAGATTRERATTAAALAVDAGLAFRKLRGHAVLKDAGEQRLYLDEAAWNELRALRRQTALILMGAVVVAISGLLLWALNR